MYDFRDLGTFIIMLAVLPLFVVVFGIVLAVYLPFAILFEVWKWLSR